MHKAAPKQVFFMGVKKSWFSRDGGETTTEVNLQVGAVSRRQQRYCGATAAAQPSCAAARSRSSLSAVTRCRCTAPCRRSTDGLTH